MPGVNIFAYGTLKYGVNVAAGNIETSTENPPNTWDEIITGPGPGTVFGPTVRAFRVDPPAASISKINFNAYAAGAYGVSVGSGNFYLQTLVEDPNPPTLPEVRDEIVTAPGPDPINATTELRAWDFVGSLARRDDQVFDRFAFEGTANGYGATLAVGTGDAPSTGNDGADLLIAGARHVDADPWVRGFEFHLHNGNLDFDPDSIDIDFKPYLDESKTWGYGARVAAVPASEPFLPNSGLTGGGFPWLAVGTTPTDHQILVARQFAQDIPDSSYVCDFCCEGSGCDPDPPPIAGQWNEWGADSQKVLVLDEMDELYHGLPDYADGAAVAAQIDVIKALVNDPTLGVLNVVLRDELLGMLDAIRASYDPMAFPSTGVTAELEWDLVTPADLALSGVDHRLYIRPGPAKAGKVQVLDTAGLFFYTDRTVPSGDGEVLRLTVPAGRREVFVASKRDCSGGGCSDFALERLSVPGVLIPDSGYLDLFTNASSSMKVNDIYASIPGIEVNLLPETVWVAFDDAGTGTLKSVEGWSNLSTATVTSVGVAGRVYVALARTPISGEKLYAAHSGGIDAIRTQTAGQPTVQNELTYPEGFGTPKYMCSGTTATGKKRIFVVSAGKLGAWEPAAEIKFKGQTTTPGNAVAVNLTADGRFVLVTRHPVSTSGGQPVTTLSTYDADTLALVRHNDTALCDPPGPCPVPPPTPIALAIDGTNGFIADPLHDRIEYLYFDPPAGSPGQARSRKARLVSAYLVTVIEAVQPAAFLAPSDQAKMVSDATLAEGFLALAEQAPGEASRKAHLSQAEAELSSILQRIDGCFGRNSADDVVTDCEEALNIYLVVSRLLTQTRAQLMEPPELP